MALDVPDYAVLHPGYGSVLRRLRWHAGLWAALDEGALRTPIARGVKGGYCSAGWVGMRSNALLWLRGAGGPGLRCASSGLRQYTARGWERDFGMVGYRRCYVPGGTYFFTVTVRDRSSGLLVERIEALRASMRAVHARAPWETVALVVLPDHLHAVWRLPEGDSDYSGRWRAIKAGFVRRVGDVPGAQRRNHRGEARIWPSRFWEHTLGDERDLRHHVDYVHINPVKHGLVQRVCDWPWSTFHREVARGRYCLDWAG